MGSRQGPRGPPAVFPADAVVVAAMPHLPFHAAGAADGWAPRRTVKATACAVADCFSEEKRIRVPSNPKGVRYPGYTKEENKMKKNTNFHVAGTTFKGRQGYICYINRNKADAYVSLRREKGNAADANAIAVIGHVNGGKHVPLGYVPRELAAQLAPVMDAGRTVWCESFRVVCGGPKRTYGVVVDITY